MTLVGLQLWTVRDHLGDLSRLFAQVADCGIEVVEPFGLGDPGKSPSSRVACARELRRAADEAGIAIRSTHTFLPTEETAAGFLEEMGELGVEYAIAAAPESLVGFSRDAFSTRESIQRYAADFNALAERVAPHGIRVGYHNHAWEWNQLKDGSLAYDVLWEELSDQVVAEIDVLWATFAGQDVLEIIARLGRRVHMLHCGDASPITDVGPQLSAGAGDSPIVGALEACEEPPAAVFIEATSPLPGVDMIDLVAESAVWLRSTLGQFESAPRPDGTGQTARHEQSRAQ